MSSLNLTGTQTANNLARAFALECQARTRYLFYGEIAQKEGYHVIQQIFNITADNERAHADTFSYFLSNGCEPSIIDTYVPIFASQGDTASNLLYVAKLEFEEWCDVYPRYAKIAEEEGFGQIAASFSSISTIEKRHEERFMNTLERLHSGALYQTPYETVWECTNCGFQIKGKGAPHRCQSCGKPQSYFKVACPDTIPYK